MKLLKLFFSLFRSKSQKPGGHKPLVIPGPEATVMLQQLEKGKRASQPEYRSMEQPRE